MTRPDHVLLYDRDCGFCRWTLDKVLVLDRGRRLRPLALQDPEAVELLAGMDEEQRMASWHLVGPDGTVSSAGRGFAPLLRLLPGGFVLAALFARLPGPSDRLYLTVATRRDVFGPRLPRGWVESSTRRIERRERESERGRPRGGRPRAADHSAR